VTAVVVCLALLLGLVAYATFGNGSAGTSAPTFNSAPPATAAPPSTANPPTTAPGTGNRPSPRTPRPTQPGAARPPTTQPGSSGNGNVGQSASTTGLDVGVVDVNTSLAYQSSAAAGPA
jgi:hypothetical protein